MTTWRLLTDSSPSAGRHMAVDEAISLSVRQGAAPPTLRLYTWQKRALTIGYFQKIRTEVNLEYCRDQDIEVVRRTTGGRAILHDPDELTYSFSSGPAPPFHKGLHDSYVQVSQAFIRALAFLGLGARMSCSRKAVARSERNPVCFQALSYAEVSVNGRKIIGSAQKRWPDGFLQQGSIPLSMDRDVLFEVLTFSSGQAKEKSRRAANEKMGGLREFRDDVSAALLCEVIREGFEQHFGIRLEPDRMTKAEEALAENTYGDRYNAGEWNFMR